MRFAAAILAPHASPTMRVLGIDPGLRVTGFSSGVTFGCSRTLAFTETGDGKVLLDWDGS
jgi:hypothetical protein